MERRLPAGLSRDDEPVYLNLDFLDGTRGRARQHQRDLGRGHQDELRDVPALLPVQVGRARGRRPSTPRRSSSTSRARTCSSSTTPTSGSDDGRQPATARSACPSSAFPSVGVLRPAPAGRRRRRCRTWPAATPASPRSSGRSTTSAGTSCCRSSSPTPRTTASSTRWSSTTSRPSLHATPRAAGDGAVQHRRARSCATFRELVDLIAGPADRRGRPARSSLGRAGDRRGHRQRVRPPPATAPCRHVEHLIRADVARSRAPPRRARRARSRWSTSTTSTTGPSASSSASSCARRSTTRSGPGRPGRCSSSCSTSSTSTRPATAPARSRRSSSTWPSGAGRLGIDPHRRAADGERGRAPHRRQLGHPRRRPPRRRRGRPGRVRLPARRVQRQRATILKPGTMIVTQPELPVPLVVEFPFPAWATRASEAGAAVGERPGRPAARRRPVRRGCRVKFLHTADWHVGKALRGRSRADEHRAVLAEIAAVADDRAGRRSCSSPATCSTPRRPSPEAEQIVYEALLASGRAPAPTSSSSPATTTTTAGSKRSRPLLELGRVTVAASFRRPDDGGVIDVPSRDGAERARVALLPFLSQRWVVRADELMATAADQQAQAYAERMRLLIQALTAGFQSDTVNVVVAHLFAMGGVLGGGEREAQTILDYAVSATAFPANAQYVALGHLHRSQVIAGPCPHPLRRLAAAARLRRDRRPQVRAGGRGPPGPAGRAPRAPADRRAPAPHARGHPRGGAGPGRDHRGRLPPRPPAGGAAGGPGRGRAGVLRRLCRRPGAPARPACRCAADGSDGAAGAGVDGHRGEPSALFRQYLAATRGEVDEALAGLFTELVEECAP